MSQRIEDYFDERTSFAYVAYAQPCLWTGDAMSIRATMSMTKVWIRYGLSLGILLIAGGCEPSVAVAAESSRSK